MPAKQQQKNNKKQQQKNNKKQQQKNNKKQQQSSSKIFFIDLKNKQKKKSLSH